MPLCENNWRSFGAWLSGPPVVSVSLFVSPVPGTGWNAGPSFVADCSKNRLILLFVFFHLSLVLAAAPANLDIRLVRNGYLISFRKPNSFPS
ncbi:hypothetical protein B0F90DRAFT_1235979 [Multifurca ochricompacta]|uniref:Uncharacterized protein n=1 Tax=Multifurca ochricompacta TaxID=376703 RepID=A0AAD4M6R8_9AGAM|nr:hypothetical protein B0F90DRAFT_1235979 [Multifurca ochricompacta]